MKAVVLHEYGPPSNLKYEDVADPKPGVGEVLVRVAATSINPIDWKLRSGAVKERMPIDLPYILGIDLAGTVESVGDRVEGFAPGDSVMAMAQHAYAERCVVKAGILVKIPEGLDTTTAASLPLVTNTGDQLIRLAAKLEPAQTVLITGALGSVGRSAVFEAHETGARIIAGVRREQIEEARQLPGVWNAIALDDDAALNALPQLDCAADTVGGEYGAKVIAKIKKGGIYGTVASPVPDAAQYPDAQINHIYAQADAATTVRYARAVRDGKLVIPLDRTMPLAHADEAHALAEKGHIAKIVLIQSERAA